MIASIATIVLGLLMIGLGIANRMGNISSLHSYHRHRVSEEDRLPLGRRVGLGMFICGASCIFFGIMMLCYEWTSNVIFEWIGTVGMLAGLAVGIVITMRAIAKYNKGLF